MQSAQINAQHWLEQTQKNALFELRYEADKLTLFKKDEPKTGGICVDFLAGRSAHRRQFGGGRGEAIAKAVGAKGRDCPSVLDATAGLGRDGFVLSAIGCKVQLLERHAVVYALLQDGLARAYQDAELGDFLQTHLILLPQGDLAHCDLVPKSVDVVYLDPMFPPKQKSAQVKKEMRLFHDLVGNDLDADVFLPLAQKMAKKRVVVKRPDYANFLNQTPTRNCVKTKSHRFDLYLPDSL